MNLAHNLVHLAIGIWGIAAYRSFDGSRTYARANAVLFAALALMGIIPGLYMVFGLVPMFSNEVWLHVLNTVAAGYFGFIATNRGAGAGMAVGNPDNF